jgi:hypothetical protein
LAVRSSISVWVEIVLKCKMTLKTKKPNSEYCSKYVLLYCNSKMTPIEVVLLYNIPKEEKCCYVNSRVLSIVYASELQRQWHLKNRWWKGFFFFFF